MVINIISVQHKGGLLPDIIILFKEKSERT